MNIKKEVEIRGFNNNKDDSLKTLQTQLYETNKEIENLKSTIKELQDLKFQIFSIMTLLFGIFAFVSIDISFTKEFFFFKAEANLVLFNNKIIIPPEIYIPIIVLISQIAFFTSIYYCFLHRFFNRNSSFYNQDTTEKHISYPLSIIFLVIMTIYFFNKANTRNYSDIMSSIIALGFLSFACEKTFKLIKFKSVINSIMNHFSNEKKY